VSTEAAIEVRLSAEVSSVKTGSAAHSTTAPVLGQSACCHRGRAKRNGRRNNKYYFAHERSPLGDAVTCEMMQLTGAKLSHALSKNTVFKIHLRFRSGEVRRNCGLMRRKTLVAGRE
jgi:hypothetical protein